MVSSETQADVDRAAVEVHVCGGLNSALDGAGEFDWVGLDISGLGAGEVGFGGGDVTLFIGLLAVGGCSNATESVLLFVKCCGRVFGEVQASCSGMKSSVSLLLVSVFRFTASITFLGGWKE